MLVAENLHQQHVSSRELYVLQEDPLADTENKFNYQMKSRYAPGGAQTNPSISKESHPSSSAVDEGTPGDSRMAEQHYSRSKKGLGDI